MDEKKFAKFYRENITRVYRYILARVGNKADSEDIAATVFMKALQGAEGYREEGKAVAWVFQIAHHEIVNFYRAAKREEMIQETLLIGFNEKLAVFENGFEALLDEFSLLTEEERNLLYLRFSGELAFGEIALILGVSEGAVRRRYSRLIQRLRAISISDERKR
jgi:RNA polymerase sigma-70 factor (ECF subfamily)